MKKFYTTVNKLNVDNRLFTAKFCCDYEKCKGACCYQPLSDTELNGGQLSDYEAADILFYRKQLSSLCEEECQQMTLEQPVSKDGDTFYTTLQKERCVFCDLKKGICVLKIAKKSIPSIDIPLSCQLYPLIWSAFPSYEQLQIGDIYDEYCVHGYEKGEIENIFMLDFLRPPLVRAFGEDFFLKLKRLQKKFL